jgi:hypothetical protein
MDHQRLGLRGLVLCGKEKGVCVRERERGLVSCEEEKVALSHGAKVVSTTTYGRNLGFLNSHEASAFAQGVEFLDSQRGTEEVFQGIQRSDAATNPRK